MEEDLALFAMEYALQSKAEYADIVLEDHLNMLIIVANNKFNVESSIADVK